MGTTRDYGQVIERELQSNPSLQKEVEKAILNAQIAQAVYDARMKAGLSQTALARLIGTQQSAISRIEDADCPSGHNIFTLFDIARALGAAVDVKFTPQLHPSELDGFTSVAAECSMQVLSLPSDYERWDFEPAMTIQGSVA